MKTDTIAAIATAMTNSGIGIIRISGEDVFTVIDRIYQSKNGKKKLSEEKSHTVHYGYIVDDTKENKIIDEVMVLIMRAPNTYTREDTVEIDCHGGVLVMQKILDTVVCHGARPAEPGEFTKRAFLNGRIDLTQAESVMDVISSKNEFALKSSISQLQGSLQKEIKELREKIIYEIAFIESALDDPEHINIDGYGQKLKTVAEECKEKIEHLLDTADNGKILKEGIDTVIVGKPNAGKSSLMNVLLKKERAIVTDIAGTTRDVLEEQMSLNGITLNIIDTAGIRDTEDIVEKIGVDKAKDYLVNADLIIYVVDSSTPLDENDEKIMGMIKDRTALVLLNKSDLDTVTTEEMIASHLDQKIIKVSMKENQGVDELENAIKELFFHGKVELNDEVYITNARHKAALSNAKDSLNMVLDSIAMEMPEDFYSIDLMNTYEELGNILGESLGEDLVNEIFSKFCTGK